ncbi:MAG TPA: hypothetical protein VM243_08710 [Phycisphaerae bacterium]|nr:hypothetical protein [Phycisphaerae bacterium]
MKRRISPGLGTLAILGLIAAGGLQADDFALDWWSIDGGGDMWTTGGEFELSGTIGQPDASLTVMTGGDFELVGGFWAIAAVQFCPGDLDSDGDTDHSDLGILLADWGCVGSGPEDCPGDVDGDFDTDHSDLGILLADWGCGT